MSTYGGSNVDPRHSYGFGYGPGEPSQAHDHSSGPSQRNRHAPDSRHRHGQRHSYSHSHGQSHSQSYGQLPSYSKGKGTSARASHAPAGESAAYDNHPAPSESQTVYDQWPNKAGDDTDRGLADYFYKKPDPSYTGTYGTDYRPEISKTKVVTAFAAAAALLYGISRFRREKEKKKHRKYAKHADRGQYSSEYGDHEEYPHDSHSRY